MSKSHDILQKLHALANDKGAYGGEKIAARAAIDRISKRLSRPYEKGMGFHDMLTSHGFKHTDSNNNSHEYERDADSHAPHMLVQLENGKTPNKAKNWALFTSKSDHEGESVEDLHNSISSIKNKGR